jgi:tRNA (adenine57-N1/adenine58-N1)-methyltransferase catalytic subunit
VAAEPFREGEVVLLLDRAQNRRLIRLRVGAKAHGHRGYLEHDRIIGADEGVTVRSVSGATYLVFRPRLSDYVLEMPRKSAIVYPKDVGIILVWADIFPGATVVESGLGSGSLTLALLRAVGQTGQVICYEKRADMIPPAVTNISGFSEPLDRRAIASRLDAGECDAADAVAALSAAPPNLIVRERDIYDGIEEREVDRLILDLSEPWRVFPHALEVLRPGATIACYSPSIIQVQRTVEELEATRGFAQIEPLEVLYRPWHVKGQAVRPVQQMVSHTAFLTFARRLSRGGRRLDDDLDDTERADETTIEGNALGEPSPESDLELLNGDPE